MRTLLLGVLTAMIGSALVVAGVGHLLHAGEFRAVLSAQGFRHRVVNRMLSATVPVVEIVLGLSLGVALVAGIEDAVRVLSLACAIVFTLFASNTWRLLRRGASVPCGCEAGVDTPVNRASLARPLLLTAASLAVSILVSSEAFSDAVATETAISLVAGIALGSTLWVLPLTSSFETKGALP